MPTPSDIWPINLLTPTARPIWRPSTVVDSGGAALSGLQQWDRIDGGPLWIAKLPGVRVWNGQQLMAFQALEMKLVGNVGTIIIPRRPAICDAFAGDPAGVPHSDGTPHGDGTPYASGTVTSAVVLAAELGADEITLQITGANRDPWGGEEFSLIHPIAGKRMYRTIEILDQLSDDTWTFMIGPPLRDDVTAGQAADFNDPGCIMRLSPEGREAFTVEQDTAGIGEFDALFEEAYW